MIELKNVNKIYGKGPTQVVALDDVSIRIKEGSAVSIMGPSGSGKTTLLNMLGALDKPTSGEVILGDAIISQIPESQLYRVRREKIGFVFQAFYLVPTMSALENVLIPTLPLGKDRFRAQAEELLRLVGLEKRMNHKPSQLSGGEQQRVAIARALVNEPEIILADEPTGNLDSKTSAEIISLLLNLNKEKGLTLIIVTHEQDIARQADNHILLRDGKVLS